MGDNPSKEEYGDEPDDTKSNGKKDKQNKQDKQDYFCGSTRYIRNFMNKWAKEEEIFYWNKTPFVTPRTKGLQEFLSKNKALFEESQKNNGKVSGWPGPEITSRYLDCRV